MNLNQLAYVVTVHRLGSLSAAAKELYVSQPSLSNAIKDLEEELQIQIFQRSKRGVVTTAEGLALVGKAKDIIRQFDDLKKGYEVDRRRNSNQLRIITMPCLQANRAFLTFCESYDEADQIAFAYWVASGNEALIEVAANNYDIGIVYIPLDELTQYTARLEQYSLEFHPMLHMECYICLSRSDPLARRSDLSLKDLENHTHLYNRSSAFLNPLNALYKIVEPESSANRHSRSIQTNVKQLNYDLLTSLRSFVFGTTLDKADLEKAGVACIPSRGNQELKFGYIKMKGKTLSQEALRFLQLLETELGDLPNVNGGTV